jgi:hypothetical protein
LHFVDSLKSGEDHSGSTATTAFITPTHIIIGNCGTTFTSCWSSPTVLEIVDMTVSEFSGERTLDEVD